jgi:tRNA dimethylallyltransferase
MKKVLAIVGPTAVGKTKLSVELAKKLNAEVINGDSVQVYKELNIGSAKITDEEMEGVKHHLLDILNPGEDFSVADFQAVVREKIDEITCKGVLPILAGGTGLYVQAVIYDFTFEDQGRDQSFNLQYEDYTNEEVHQELVKVDPKSALDIHPNNRRRVLRALEIFHNAKESKSEMLEKQKHEKLYDALIIGLDLDRELLYDRINKRVDIMIEQGLLEEVKKLYDRGIKVNVISYKEFYDYFEGKKSLEAAIEEVKKDTRNLAKRQLTYFRNKLDVQWVTTDLNDFSNTVSDAFDLVKNWLNQE